MAVEAARPPLGGKVATVSMWSRFYGFGSIYAKTLRDSRLTFMIVAGLLGGIMVAGGHMPSPRAFLLRRPGWRWRVSSKPCPRV